MRRCLPEVIRDDQLRSTTQVGKTEENGITERLTRTIWEEIDFSEYRDFAVASGEFGRFLDDLNNLGRISSRRWAT